MKDVILLLCSIISLVISAITLTIATDTKYLSKRTNDELKATPYILQEMNTRIGAVEFTELQLDSNIRNLTMYCHMGAIINQVVCESDVK